MSFTLYVYVRLYRLNPKRKLGNLFGVARDGCTDVHSGIGNVSYVKDILTDTIVTKKFKCSKFGPHANTAFGWVKFLYNTINNKLLDESSALSASNFDIGYFSWIDL